MTAVWRAMSPALAVVCVLVSGCGKDDGEERFFDRDPVESQALGDPIMTDPDLDSQNRANDGLAARDARSMAIPEFDRGAAAVAAARADALAQAGGTIRSAPTPERGPTTALTEAMTAGQFAAAIRGPGSDCPSRIEYSAIWAARLTGALTVYPRGHVQEAGGTDAGGCRLRVVNFVSPVDQNDIVDWYYTRLSSGGYGFGYRIEGADHVLRGGKGRTEYAILVRRRDDGLSEVSLAVNGD